MTKSINISNHRISNSDKLTVIAGLNILESEEQTLEVAAELKKIVSKTDNPFIFKASFDKANRSSVDSYRGMGIDKGITIFKA